MRSLPAQRTLLFNRNQSSRVIRQKCYAERIREDSGNWRWYYHLAREMLQNNLSLVSVDTETFTTQDLLLRAIAINPNEGCNWALLSQNWPSNQSSVRVAIEDGEEFCFTKRDAVDMTRELDTSKYTSESTAD